MDYRLTDPHLDPPGGETIDKYTETSIHLPETFWCYDPMCDEPVADPPVTRNGYITFGSLSNFAKVNDGVLALWSRVLTNVPNARLIVQAPAGSARKRVRAALESHGVDSARVEFVGFLRRPNYLHTYSRIDIVLDTVPYNGHTTNMDAMWMGVPVVTLRGHTVVGRAGWSQLNNLGLTDLAATDDGRFVRIAAELAGDVPRLRELRGSLRERMRASPLIDARRFGRNMEAAFRTMWRRWCTAARADGKP
jgi:predicted O-linked N-acetylglucosamine transferase (SPINDLY family)